MALILQYNHSFPPVRDGSATFVNELVRNIEAHEFEVLTSGVVGHRDKERISRNVMVKRFDPPKFDLGDMKETDTTESRSERKRGGADRQRRKARFPFSIWGEYHRLKTVSIYLRKKKFDLIHFHGLDIMSSFRMDRILKSRYFTKKGYGIAEPLFSREPRVLTVHGIPLARDELFDFGMKLMLERFEHVTYVDRNIEDYLKKICEEMGVSRNLRFIPNSVDTNRFAFSDLNRRDWNRKGERLVIGFIGRIEYSRGLPLLKALTENLPKNTELIMVGSGDIGKVNKFLSSIKNQSELSRVNFSVNLRNEEVPAFLQGIDVLFNPVLADGISRVSLEAMACGRPVIMTEGKSRYPVVHGKSGFIIKNEPEELLSLLDEITGDAGKLGEMGKCARKMVEREFSHTAVFPKFGELYEELIQSGQGAGK